MSGLSSTLYDSGSIELIGGHSAAATSGDDGAGRALSDVAHSTGLRYAEFELTQVRSTVPNYYGVGATSDTGSLNMWIGSGTDAGFYIGFGGVARFQSGGITQSVGTVSVSLSQRMRVWVNCATRKMWVSARPWVGPTWWTIASPATGTGEAWTIPGTGPIRLACRPANGSGTNRNVLRFRSRYSEIDVSPIELAGALPWDARSVTINLVMRESIGGRYIAAGTEVSYAVFEGSTPGVLSTPTTVGTATMGAYGSLALPASISVDPGATLGVLVSTTAGTPGTQARSHYMPVTAP